MYCRPRPVSLCLLFVFFLCSVAAAAEVSQPTVEAPVVAEVDVLVVGGSVRGVAAAKAAAESGAEVMLVTPRPYLGDEMTATLQLWLNPGETLAGNVLARELYRDPLRLGGSPNASTPSAPFSYTASPKADAKHPDNRSQVLCDGKWRDPSKESVQYSDDATIEIDLTEAGKVRDGKEIKALSLYAFKRTQGKLDASDGFSTKGVSLYASETTAEGKPVWKLLGKTDTPRQLGKVVYGNVVLFEIPVDKKVQKLKLVAELEEGYSRQLLGEIVLTPSVEKKASAKKSAKTSLPAPRPMHVKKVLEEWLIAAKVPFLYCCYTTEALLDEAGHPTGVVISNRNGRQVIRAKTIIDATHRGEVARLLGEKFTSFKPGKHEVRFVVVGGTAKKDGRVLPNPFFSTARESTNSRRFPLVEYSIAADVPADTPSAWAAVEQSVRLQTYDKDQQVTSDIFSYVPQSRLAGEPPARLWLLSPSSNVSDVVSAKLMRPVYSIPVATQVGKEVAAASQKIELPSDSEVVLAQNRKQSPEMAAGEVSELLVGLRPLQKVSRLTLPATSIPVVAQCDVLVVGGGTAGAPAGIGAARQGAKTIVIEYLHGLGGVGTKGLISKYYHGNRVGFAQEVDNGRASWVPQQREHWYLNALDEAGGKVWFGATGSGVLVDRKNKTIRGAIVATPWGRGAIVAKVVIDSTGAAGMADAAGIPCQYLDKDEFAVQGTGLPPIKLGATYTNTDWSFSHEGDIYDITRMFIHAKHKNPNAFDLGQLIDTRERRRVLGEFFITPLDQMCSRTYPDTVVRTKSNYDTHGYTMHPFFVLQPPNRESLTCNLPYRSLLPKDWEGLLVTGLGVSVHRDAIPIIRMQPGIQNQGYAAGVAAAMAAKENLTLRKIDLKKLQKHLVKIGNLQESVLTDTDSFPLSDAKLTRATQDLAAGKRTLHILLSAPARAVPLLQKAYATAEGQGKKNVAMTLMLLGDERGLDYLAETLNAATQWDAGWNYRGMGQFGATVSPLDQLVYVLGSSRSKKALPAILAKAKLLDAKQAFSHHRMVALALERIGDPSGAAVLYDVLQKPEMQGHAQSSLSKVRQLHATTNNTDNICRNNSLRELSLARALLRLGDKEGLGEKIVRQYARDLRGHFAEHAKTLLLEAGKELNEDAMYESN